MDRERNADGTFKASHGMKHSRIYRVWSQMKRRCECPQDKSFLRYGAKGIKVCDEWKDFRRFYEWAAANGYREGLTIDRKNNRDGYNPENCRFVTTAEQNRNYSRNHLITYNGRTQCIADWADETGVNRSTILYRLKAGKTVEEALSTIDGRTTRWKKTTSQSCTA